MARPRVIFLVLQHGGLGLYGVCLAKHMAKHVDTRILVSPKLYESPMVRSHLKGTDTVIFQSAGDLFSARSVVAIRELLQEISTFSPDAVHDTIGYSNKQLLAARPFLHRQYQLLVTVHDPVPHSGMSNWTTELSRIVSHRFAQKLVVHGPWCKQRLQATGVEDHNIVQMHLGPFDIFDQEIQGERKSLSHSSDTESKNILFFGTLRVNKGILELPEIIRLIKEQQPESHFVVAGNSNHAFADDAWRTEMSKIVAELRSMGAIVHDRYIDDEEVKSFFQDASLVILPYRDGSQSGVAAIAGTFGRAAVATDVGDLPSAVVHNKTGRIVPAHNATKFADEVVQLLRSPDLIRSYGEAAYLLYAEQQNSWAQAATILLPHYRKNPIKPN